MKADLSDIDALRQAIMQDVNQEAEQILTDAQTQADSLRTEAEVQANAERDDILQQARQEAETTRTQAAATAQIEARTLKLKRREQLLQRTFDAARERLASAQQWSDYGQIVRRLVHEGVKHLDADEIIVRADGETQKMLDDDALDKLSKELNVHVHAGEPLAQGTGVVLETPNGHRRYDNTLETRLARIRDGLRMPIYRILTGETS
jgi:vacuolar-type H+-ATPase subunit E/Vma4